jgi:hypothetical protein
LQEFDWNRAKDAVSLPDEQIRMVEARIQEGTRSADFEAAGISKHRVEPVRKSLADDGVWGMALQENLAIHKAKRKRGKTSKRKH